MTESTRIAGRAPLDSWIAQRLGITIPNLTRSAMSAYQLRALRDTIAWARVRSPFYAGLLSAFGDQPLNKISDLARLPFTTPEDLTRHGPKFLCVSQDEISRVVSLDSSGTNGVPKRVFFTSEDQERALDFFAAGAGAIAAPGERMLIGLPGEREGSVGYQVAKGVERAGLVPVPHGLIHDPVRALELMERLEVSSIIGFPVQILSLARQPSTMAGRAMQRLRSVVFCSDHVPASLAEAVRRRSGCEIFEHYGSTEMGLGGGVDCLAHMGYHMRETDLLFEIVSPQTGETVTDGEPGEVVFTTLNRRAMPLIRYRTGDISRIVPGPCPCGSPTIRLERIRNRVGACIDLASCGKLSLAVLDEALFAIPGLLDFRVVVSHRAPLHLELTIFGHGHARSSTFIRHALQTVPAIGSALASQRLELGVTFTDQPFTVTGAKRVLARTEAA